MTTEDGGMDEGEQEEMFVPPGGATTDEKDGNNNKGLPRFLAEGLQTRAGKRGTNFAAGGSAETVSTFMSNEAGNYQTVRSQTPQMATLVPQPGRTPFDAARFVRYVTEYLRVPIDFYDKAIVWRKDKDGNWETVKILQPGNFSEIPPERWWVVWCQGGPFYETGTHEARLRLRAKPEYKYFFPTDQYNYSLLSFQGGDPWWPDTLHGYWALNPGLKGLSMEEIQARRANGPLPRDFTDWRPLNETELLSHLIYLRLLIRAGAQQDPRAARIDRAAQIDFHMNGTYGTLANPMRGMQLDEQGNPIYEKEADTAYYGPKLIEQSQYAPLIGSEEWPDAESMYKLNKGYGLDFDPSNRPRDPFGNYHPEEDIPHGIMSDWKRFADTEYEVFQDVEGGGKFWQIAKHLFNALIFWKHETEETTGEVEAEKKEAEEESETEGAKPQERKDRLAVQGPRHSVVDIMLDGMVEAQVELGKEIQSKKVEAQIRRLFSTGQLTWSDIEKATSGWFVGPVGGMAERCIDESTYFLDYLRFWAGATDPVHGFINGFTLAMVNADAFYKLVANSPQPTDLRKLAARWQYWQYEPIRSDWGLDREGRPRVPQRLLEKLIRHPSLGGINMICHNDRPVLENYRERVGDDEIRVFWNMSEEAYAEALGRGEGDFLTMGHCFWKPMDQAGDFERGLLAELWRNQPPQPLVQRVDHRFTFLARMGQIYVWHELEKIFADMPIEVILAAGKELDKMHSQADDAIRLFMQLKGQGRHKQGFRAWQYLDAGEATLVNHYGQRINPDDDPEVWMEAFWELYRPWEYAWRCGQVDKETWFVRAIRANPRLRNHPDKIMDLATTAMIGGANPRFIEGAIELLIEAGDFGKGVKLSDFWMEKGKTEQEEALDTAWGTTTHGFVGGDEPAKLVEGGQMMQAVCTRGR